MKYIIIKFKQYKTLVKFTLSLLVVFTSVISYLLVPEVYWDWKMIGILFFAGFCVTASANAINQILEKDSDVLMARTAVRPVAAGKMSPEEAGFFAFMSGSIGILLFCFYFNWNSALLALLSLVIYAWIYTPMKKYTSFSVITGAFPGALPCLIGWMAGQDNISNPQAWVTFSIQFFWQFPHFWSIAWIAHKDYEKAGFKLLPSKVGPSKYTALQSILYSIVLIPVGFLPYFLGISGVVSFYILLICNCMMVYLCIRLYILQNKKQARMIMFASYIYILIVFLSLLFDKSAY